MVLAASGVGFCLSLCLLPLPQPNIGLILLYLHLSLHLLIPAVTSSTNTTAVTPLSLSCISGLVQTPILHQPFVVSPGFWLVPVKLVSQIMAGKFVELNELLSANLVLSEPQASITVLVLTSTPKNQFVRGLSSVLPYFIVPFPASLGRFVAILATYPPDSPPVHWFGYCLIGLFANTLL